MKDPGYRLYYDKNYREAEKIVVIGSANLDQSEFPEVVDGVEFKRIFSSRAGQNEMVITKMDHPEVFKNSTVLAWARGQAPILPITEMRGKLDCTVKPEESTLLLTLFNQSGFDWRLGAGPLPIRIGVHIYQPDGALMQFDGGFRVPTDAYVKRGTSHTVSVPLDVLRQSLKAGDGKPFVAQFALVQDANAWFNELNCSIGLQ